MYKMIKQLITNLENDVDVKDDIYFAQQKDIEDLCLKQSVEY